MTGAPPFGLFLCFPSQREFAHICAVNADQSTPDRQNPDSKPTPHHAFFKLFSAGVLGWLVGAVVLFGLSWLIARPESISSAMIWTISHCWVAFLFGLLVLVAVGLKSGLSVGRAAIAYLLPVVVLALVAGICLLIYPDNLLREELLTYLPVVLLFYGLGLLWMRFGKEETSETPSSARAVIPAVVGGLVILGAVAGPVFASDAFRYRDTFEFSLSKASLQDGAIKVEGTIEIRKPGNFKFSAPRYVWNETPENAGSEPRIELGKMSWGAAGEPKSGSSGVFPVQISWGKGASSLASEYAPYEDYVVIEVRNPDVGDKVIYSMSAPMQSEP